MFLGVRGGPGTSPIDGESKNILAVLFSDFFERGEAGSDPFFDFDTMKKHIFIAFFIEIRHLSP